MAPEPVVAWARLLRYSRHTIRVEVSDTYRMPRAGWSGGSRTEVGFYRCEPNGTAREARYDAPPECQPGNYWDREHKPEPIPLADGLAAVEFETFRGKHYVRLVISTGTAQAWGLSE